ncbi:hypothetical protein Rhe02_54680 [Rhizocola hellebori]|uniref:Uncharacterized protein n=1 Tax=Rhizocola hellebori TaxID=1392758 RepID=A0A8J3QDL4_9ACTN|nr:hypothetical protein [Rhizocola hellebori]GIH07401.1 hypothetical protein Rhe02_54680 [Rhizocola hellebori]
MKPDDADFMELTAHWEACRRWRDTLIEQVRRAVDADSGYGGAAGLHSRLLERVQLVLTAKAGDKDGDGVLVALPGSRRLCQWLLVELAEANGLDVPEHP